ncbi:Crp/Fnr family transcriptional regulator [Hyunsoonleella sp. 2307UL5-6]|uniref:Crp/Fnr family transcriptional regulator n=1 Tax=Hyunsoonleella sp. 2307UL5-6 TaxID=3384768 RepID=UPI0039BC9B8B
MDILLTKLNSVLPISLEEQLLMKNNMHLEIIKKGEIYSERGKICRKLGFVLEGVFKVVRTNSNEDEFIQYFTTEGHFAVDIDSFTNKTPSKEYIKALTKCSVVTITDNSFKLFEDKVANFSKIISSIKEQALLEKYNLKSEMFVDDAQTKYKKLIQRHPSIVQRIPQNQIASFLGITQYTLSRIRAVK